DGLVIGTGVDVDDYPVLESQMKHVRDIETGLQRLHRVIPHGHGADYGAAFIRRAWGARKDSIVPAFSPGLVAEDGSRGVTRLAEEGSQLLGIEGIERIDHAFCRCQVCRQACCRVRYRPRCHACILVRLTGAGRDTREAYE